MSVKTLFTMSNTLLKHPELLNKLDLYTAGHTNSYTSNSSSSNSLSRTKRSIGEEEPSENGKRQGKIKFPSFSEIDYVGGHTYISTMMKGDY